MQQSKADVDREKFDHEKFKDSLLSNLALVSECAKHIDHYNLPRLSSKVIYLLSQTPNIIQSIDCMDEYTLSTFRGMALSLAHVLFCNIPADIRVSLLNHTRQRVPGDEKINRALDWIECILK